MPSAPVTIWRAAGYQIVAARHSSGVLRSCTKDTARGLLTNERTHCDMVLRLQEYRRIKYYFYNNYEDFGNTGVVCWL